MNPLRASAAIAICMSLLAACSSPLVKAKGTMLAHEGRPFFIRGVALMDDSTLWDSARALPDPGGIGERDWASAASGGRNAVRLAVKMDYFVDEAGAPRKEGFAFLDRQIALAKKHGLLILLDMHVPPGGAIQDYRETEENRRFWADAALMERFVGGWRMIAGRHRDEAAILGFELMNEPAAPHAEYCGLMRRAAEAIRAADDGHLIVLQPSASGALCPPPVGGIAYSFHFYAPMAFTHQGISGAIPGGASPAGIRYPGAATDASGGAKRFDRAALAQEIAALARMSRANEAPAILGEFGVSTAADEGDAAAWISDVLGLIEEEGFAGYIQWREFGPGR